MGYRIRIPSFFGVAVSLVLVSGCVVDSGVEGAFYPNGYSDGCRTAEARQASFSTSEYRDETMFRTEKSYRAGWRSGYAQCDRTMDIDNRPGDLGEVDPR